EDLVRKLALLLLETGRRIRIEIRVPRTEFGQVLLSRARLGDSVRSAGTLERRDCGAWALAVGRSQPPEIGSRRRGPGDGRGPRGLCMDSRDETERGRDAEN